MPPTSSFYRIMELLDTLQKDFPRRQKAAEELMKQHGIDDHLALRIGVPEKVTELPTFDSQVFLPATEMLRARFEYAGDWNEGGDIWLNAQHMAVWMKKEPVLSYHQSLRENWEGSAPMLFPDDQLTLFGITEGVEDNLTYLVWRRRGHEPEVWRYGGLDSRAFENLEVYLNWRLQRE